MPDMSHRPFRGDRPAFAAALFALALGLAGCPDLPGTPDPLPDIPVGDTAIDADIFISLALDRVHESVGEPAGGERVTVYGAGFTKGAQVFFDEEQATSVLVLDKDRMNCTVPAHSAALVDVRVVLPDGQEAVLPSAYLYRGPLRLESIEPTIDTALGGVEVTVHGEGFDSSTRVLIGGRLLHDPELVDEHTIRGRVPSRLQGRAGLVEVIATDGFEQRVLMRAFRYVDDLEVRWVSPTTGPWEGGTAVALYGSGLAEETVVSVDGVVAETLMKGRGGSMIIRTPPGVHGPTDLLVDNGLQTQLVAGGFTYVDPDAVQPSGVELLGAWPTRGRASGGEQVSLAVHGLPSQAAGVDLKVTFEGKAAAILQVDSFQGELVVVAPSNAPGPATIRVESLGSSSERNNLYEYLPEFGVDSLSPDGGSVAGGEAITLTGAGLDADASVVFGHEAATEVQPAADGALRVTVPPGVPGLVDVRVHRADGEVMIAAGFEYRSDATPKLLAIAPPDGAQAGGRLLRLYGEGFAATSLPSLQVAGATVPAAEIRRIDDATVHLFSPHTVVGTYNVVAGELGTLAKPYGTFDPTSVYGGTDGGPIPEAINVTVLDAATRDPIPEAFVILWDDIFTPHQGLTDERGQITFSAAGFGPPQMVTASKDEATTGSFVDFDARNVTIFLITFSPADPGDPGGGPGNPQDLPPGRVAGDISGIDKYIVVPPGECDSLVHEPAPGTLCAPCFEDADCLDEGARCVDLGEQGKRCTTACLTDADCREGFSCVGVAFGQVQCIPSPGVREVWCGTTVPDIFTFFDNAAASDPTNPLPQLNVLPMDGFTNGENVYDIETPPGEHAVVCFGGYMEQGKPETFVPVTMGVRRHVFTLPADLVGQQDIKLDIPLDRDLHIRLEDVPVGEGEARYHEVDVFVDLGPDGVFHMPSRVDAILGMDQTEYLLKHFPTKFEESLYDASYTLFAGAYTEATLMGQSSAASFVHHAGVTNPDEDSVFQVLPQIAEATHTKTGIKVDIHAMHGPGTARVWAAGAKGRVLTFDGTWWGLQQTPTGATLRDIWAAHDSYVWTVGDLGSVFRYEGVIWQPVDMPRDLATTDWWAVTGAGSSVWVVGEQGVWHHDGERVEQIFTDENGRPQVIQSVWAESPEVVWLVGESGLIRRWPSNSGFQGFDRPGTDFLHISGTAPNDVWAVGRSGRIAHFNGDVWFDYLPVTRRDLHAVHAVDSNIVWAVGDSGDVLRWDGMQWERHLELEHVDLRGIRVIGDGRILTGGLQGLILGPFLSIPKPINPTATGLWADGSLEWEAPGEPGSFTYLQMTDVDGFPFWILVVNGKRTVVPLPDLEAAWGIPAIEMWRGEGFLQLWRATMPGVTIDRWDWTDLDQTQWRAWSQNQFFTVW